jgi:hypothetical protein
MAGTRFCPSGLKYDESQCNSLDSLYIKKLYDDFKTQINVSIVSGSAYITAANAVVSSAFAYDYFSAPIQLNPNPYNWGLHMIVTPISSITNGESILFGLRDGSDIFRCGFSAFWYRDDNGVPPRYVISCWNGSKRVPLIIQDGVLGSPAEMILYRHGQYFDAMLYVGGNTYTNLNYFVASTGATLVNRKPRLNLDSFRRQSSTAQSRVYINYLECFSPYGALKSKINDLMPLF